MQDRISKEDSNNISKCLSGHYGTDEKGLGVAGDEMVFWQSKDGRCHYTQIQNVPIGDDIRSEVLSTTPMKADLGGVFSRIKHSSGEDLMELTTAEGMRVKMVRVHGLFTIGDDGDIRKIQPGEIVEGETLIPRAQPTIPFGSGRSTLEMRTKSGRGKQLKIDLGRDAGFIFGTFAADGSTCGKNHYTVMIAARETEIRQETVKVYEKWGLNPILHDDYIATACSALGRTLAEKCGTGAENKRIPDLLWTAPPEFRDGFISGYISGDGTASGGQVTISTASREMAEGMVFLLGSRGIRASYRTYDKGEHQDQHKVTIYHEWVENLPELLLTRKQKAAQKIAASPNNRSRDRIPVPENLKTEVARAMNSNDVPRHGVYTKGYVSRPRLRLVYADLPDRMQELVDAPIWWEVVESVENIGPAGHTFDLGMKRHQNWMVAGGMLARSMSPKAIPASKSVESSF